jgi:hypothetical protein
MIESCKQLVALLNIESQAKQPDKDVEQVKHPNAGETCTNSYI